MRSLIRLSALLLCLGTVCFAQNTTQTQVIGTPTGNNTMGCLGGYDHLPCVVATIKRTGLTSAVGATNWVVIPQSGFYLVSAYVVVTATTATGGTILPTFGAASPWVSAGTAFWLGSGAAAASIATGVLGNGETNIVDAVYISAGQTYFGSVFNGVTGGTPTYNFTITLTLIAPE